MFYVILVKALQLFHPLLEKANPAGEPRERRWLGCSGGGRADISGSHRPVCDPRGTRRPPWGSTTQGLKTVFCKLTVSCYLRPNWRSEWLGNLAGVHSLREQSRSLTQALHSRTAPFPLAHMNASSRRRERLHTWPRGPFSGIYL